VGEAPVKRLTNILRDHRGFTLVELMLVIIIIGVLVAMVAPRLAGRSQQAKEAAARADIQANLSTALDLFEMHHGRYPTTAEGLAALRTAPAGASDWKGPYLKRPVPLDPWGKPYGYRSPGQHNREDYDLFSTGPDGVEGTADDIANWN
jgi:general secretion pathway protein G